MTRTTTPAAERLWNRVEKTSTCWNWTGCLDRKGYGIIGDTVGEQKISLRVHRLAYSLLVGPLADGVQVDHRCHNRRCVNPQTPTTDNAEAEPREPKRGTPKQQVRNPRRLFRRR